MGQSAIRRASPLVASALFALAALAACRVDVSLGTESQDDGSSASGLGGFDAGGGGPGCEPGPVDDFDGDGYSLASGDCNDCDPFVGPNAIEVVSPDRRPVDEDCDGEADEPPDPPCDDDLLLDEADPFLAALALDQCKLSNGFPDWGIVVATWVLPDGTAPEPELRDAYDLGHGLLPDFGPNVAVQRGARMLALSSGTARRPSDPGFQPVDGFDKGYESAHPNGLPIESPSCGPVELGQPHDGAALELILQAPANALGIGFDFAFYTREWPEFVCSSFDDFFLALLWPPLNSESGNVSFDRLGNPISVNNAFLEVCGCPENPPDPCFAGGKEFACGLGNAELIGTGFGFDFDAGGLDHAATGWLVTEAQLEPGSEIVLRFTIYDSGDGSFDSTVLIDNLRWLAEPGMSGTMRAPR